MLCENIQNPMMDFSAQVASVNNPPGQPIQGIALQTTPRGDGGQVGGPGTSSGSSGGQTEPGGQGQIAPGNNGAALGAAVKMTPGSFSIAMIMMMGALVVLSTSISW